ncbi:MAG: transcription factor E [Candidatus Hadarchaeales archaeon]
MAKRKAAIKEKKLEKRQEKTPNLEPILETVGYLVGEKGERVIRALTRGEMTDEELAKKTNLQVNQIRSILYILHENRIVSYRREREENSGWYVHYWRLEPERALDYIKEQKAELLRKLEERLAEEESKIYFTCEKEYARVSYENAMGTEFKCPTCGGTLKPYDNSAIVNSLKAQIERLRRELS